MQASGVAAPGGGWLSSGPLIASFERADVRLTGAGLCVDADDRQWTIEFPRGWDGRDGRLASFYHAIANGAPMCARSDGTAHEGLRRGSATRSTRRRPPRSTTIRAPAMNGFRSRA